MKFLIILLIAWSFVFSGQKTFARDTAIVLPPAPTYTAVQQRAVTANGDTIAIREIVKEKVPCEKCECAKNSITYENLIWIALMLFVVFVLF